MKFTDLKQKEVINCKDGKRIGCVVDLDFDPGDGCICDLYIALFKNKCFCFHKPKILRIPYKDVKKIGPDIILVNIQQKT